MFRTPTCELIVYYIYLNCSPQEVVPEVLSSSGAVAIKIDPAVLEQVPSMSVAMPIEALPLSTGELVVHFSAELFASRSSSQFSLSFFFFFFPLGQ